MERPWPERREALLQERDAQVQAATTPQELAEKCVAIIASAGGSAQCSWADTNPLLTIAYKNRAGETGHFYGYGQAGLEAATQCFQNIWFKWVVLPSALSPTEAEVALRRDGQALHAIRGLMERTGVSLREARDILEA